MGKTESKHESKAVDTNGAVNNNLVIQGEMPIQVHNMEILILLYIMCALKVLEFLYFVYTKHSRKLKKRYNSVNNIV